MTHLDQTLTQSRAISTVNQYRNALQFIRRLYKSNKPLGTTDDQLHAYLVACGWCRTADASDLLLMLTEEGREEAQAAEREVA